MLLDGLEWQHQGDNDWVFGRMIRGVIRLKIGEAYLNDGEQCEWVWFVKNGTRGTAPNLESAVDFVEAVVCRLEIPHGEY